MATPDATGPAAPALPAVTAIEARLADSSARGLANAVGSAMRDGALQPGDKLPPIRAVAGALRISPTTVSAAWALLRRSGTIRTDGRRGTVVGHVPDATALRLRRTVDRETSFRVDLAGGVPDPALLPDLRAALHGLTASAAPATYLDDPNLPELVALILDDWPYPASELMIVDGAMDAIELVSRTALQFGDRVIVEHPGFPPIQDLLEFLGARVVPVAVDAEGLALAELAEALRLPVAAVYLQPRAQNPTGVSMTPRRAERIADLVRGAGALVVEDDSAGGAASSPLRSIGHHLPEQTVHVRSFSKSHGPDLRLAAMSAPPALLATMAARRQLGQGWTSRVLQRIMISLLTDAGSVRQVAAARETYRQRRADLVGALRAAGVDVGGDDGINVWVPVRDETAAVLRLASKGIGVAPGTPFMSRPTAEQFVRVTSGLATGDIPALALEIAAAAQLEPWGARR